MGNKNLLKARIKKDDEFYTLYEDVSDFLKYYGENGLFKNKIIHLPCDSKESNFYKYLKDNFDDFKIKEIIATEYNPEGGTIFRFSETGESVEKVKESMSYLEKESQDISLVSDFVITNPPFSSINEYIKFILRNKKDFIILTGLGKISNINFLPISKNIGEKYFYYGCNLLFNRSDGSKKGVPVMWVTSVKNEYKKIRKLSDQKPFDLVINMLTPDGDKLYSCSNVKMLNNLPKGTKYVLVPITIATYEFGENFEILGFTNQNGFGNWYIKDTKINKMPSIKDKDGENKTLYTRAVLRVK